MMRWHRIIGLITGILIVVLALSGIALTHSTQLGLDRRTITAPWLLSWMGAQSDAEIYFYALGPHSVAILDDRVFFDGVMIAQTLEGGVGAVKIANAIAVAGKSEILLLTENGALIERVTALPVPVTGIGVTQDGRVARQLVGENSTVEKEYLVRVEGNLDRPSLALLNHGLELDGKQLRPAKVSWANPEQLRFVLREGRKRQIRRMCELVGLRVTGLKRVRIGRVRLGDLPVGQWRFLREDEGF